MIHQHQAIVYMTFFQTNLIRVILKNVQALPRFIMAVNEVLRFWSPKSASLHYKSAPHGSGMVNKGLMKRSDVFV